MELQHTATQFKQKMILQFLPTIKYICIFKKKYY